MALDLQKQGYAILAWSARPENRWEDFLFEAKMLLTPEDVMRYEQENFRLRDESAQARLLLRFLMARTRGKLVLFLDNLESLQDPETHQLGMKRSRPGSKPRRRRPRLDCG